MVWKNKPQKKTAALATIFGSATACLFVATDMQADLVELSFSPSSILFNSLYPQAVGIDELGLGFVQWNDYAGKTLYAQSLTSITVVNEKATISPGGFLGTFEIPFPPTVTGDMFIGFRSAGDVGWFKINFAGAIGPITYVEGIYGNDGENLIVGGGIPLLGDINCDGVVDLLDVQPFVELLQSGKFEPKGDMNGDGTISLLDVEGFVDAINNP